jgi:hypothetical protein
MGYRLLAAISFLGLFASVGCHLAGWLGDDPPGGKAAFALHAGIFAVWVPLVVCANRTMPPGAGGNLDHLLAELPRWARAAVGALFGYALVNFVSFVWSAGQYPKGGVPLALEVRGVSGHWMLFYGVAWAGFVALARLARLARKRPAPVASAALTPDNGDAQSP